MTHCCRSLSIIAAFTLTVCTCLRHAAAQAPLGPVPSQNERTTAIRDNSPDGALTLDAWDPNVVQKPNFGDIIEQKPPEGMALERVRRRAAFKLAGGTLTLLCPNRDTQCTTEPGVFGTLTLLHRPETWFAWGFSLDGFGVRQTWREPDVDIALTHHIAAGRVLAELHPLSDSWVDPYFGLGLGVGFIATKMTVANNSNERSLQGPLSSMHNTTWTPFYAARLGVDFAITERLRAGIVVDWSNLLALTGENCPWKAFGACSSSGWASFPADNAVWKLGAEVSFVFGQEL